MAELHIVGRVTHTDGAGPVENAVLQLYRRGQEEKCSDVTHAGGEFNFRVSNCDAGDYSLVCRAFGERGHHDFTVSDHPSFSKHVSTPVSIDIPIGFELRTHSHDSRHEEVLIPALHAVVGRRMQIRAETRVDDRIAKYEWREHRDAHITPLGREADLGRAADLGREAEVVFDRSGSATIEAIIVDKDGARAKRSISIAIAEADVQRIDGRVRVSMERTLSDCTEDQALWVAIRNRTHAISFERYHNFIERIVNAGNEADAEMVRRLSSNLRGVGSYLYLKYLTEAFLVLESGVKIDYRQHHHHYRFDPHDEAQRLGEHCADDIETRLRHYLGEHQLLPYLRTVVKAAFPDFERELWNRGREVRPADRLVLAARLDQPVLIELIHTYWLEEGMLMQTMNALCERFQNIRSGNGRDPLANVEIDPLRPLNNLLWGWIRDEIHQLSVRQRAFEYLHEYGLTLFGRATAGIRPADNRSTFLAAFHNLLYQSTIFFKEDFQTTVIADGFPLLNCLKEVHLILSQGAGNAFGDLPWTARVETLVMQYILARPEIRDFLQSRAMVPYKERWMPQIDTMKTLQGWTDVTITHFRDLAAYGEQLLLSIRYGDWIVINDEDAAKNWARYWRAEIQGYLHAYRAVTGVDLGNPVTAGMVDATLPGIHLQKRLEAQATRSKEPNMLGYGLATGQLALPRLSYPTRRSE
jgi:hypothetical protein